MQTQSGADIRLIRRHTVLDSVYRGSNEVSNPGVKEQYWTTELTAFFRQIDRLLLSLTLPMRRTEGDGELIEGEAGVPAREDVTGDATGMGDVALLARYTLLARHTLDSTTLVAALLGVKLPTGPTSQHDQQGEYLDSHLQPGTGSTDLLVGLSVDRASGRWSLAVNALAAFAGEGETGDARHEFGDSLNYDITAKYRLRPDILGAAADSLFVSFGVNGEARGREHLDGRRVADSGGHTVYLTPGLQYVLNGRWILEATYQYAVYHDLENLQLGEDYRAFTSVTRTF